MLIPATTVPVTIIGAFAAMAALGFTINFSTLFAIVLAIGIGGRCHRGGGGRRPQYREGHAGPPGGERMRQLFDRLSASRSC